MSPVAERVETTSTSHDRSEMVVEAGLNFFEIRPDLIGEKLQRTKHLPEQLIERYLREALKSTSLRKIDGDVWFAEIPGFDGVWASDADLAKCVSELRDALYDWLVIKIEHNDRDLPVVADIRLNSI
jgi:predicted RNase H-like HicB family nuclease